MLKIRVNDTEITTIEMIPGKPGPSKENPWMNLSFQLPLIYLFRYERDEFGEWLRKAGIVAPTIFIFYKDDFIWDIHCTLLGFGVSFSKQTGY